MSPIRTRAPKAPTSDDIAPAPLNVLVLGMHRSGTSAVSEALRAAGFEAGPDEGMMEPEAQNPVGFGERLEVALFNDRLLASLGWYWDAPDPAPQSDPPERSELVAEGRDLVRRAVFGTRPFVLKDPRISLLLPWWRQILLDRFVPVVVLRRPDEVAWSLKVRDGFPLELGVALWAAYHRHLAAGLAGLSWIAVDYERLCDEPQRSFSDLIKSLESLGVRASVDRRAGARTIRPGLRRATQPIDAVDAADERAILETALQWLGKPPSVAAAFDPAIPPPDEWQEAILRVHRRARDAQERERSARSELVDQQRRMTQLAGRHAELEHETAALRERSTTLGQQLANLSHERDEARSSASETGSRLAALTAQTLQLTKARDELAAHRQAADQRLTELQAHKADLESRLADLEHEVREARQQRDAEQSKVADLSARLATVVDEVAELQSQLDHSKQQADEIAAERDSDRSRLAALQADVAALTAQTLQLTKARDELAAQSAELAAQLDTAGELLAGSSKTISEFDAQRAEIRQVATRLRRELGKAKRALASERDRALELEGAVAQLTIANSEIEILRSRTQQLEFQLSVTAKERVELAASASELQNEVASVRSALTQTEQAALDRERVAETRLTAAHAHVVELENAVSAVRTELGATQADVESLSHKLRIGNDHLKATEAKVKQLRA